MASHTRPARTTKTKTVLVAGRRVRLRKVEVWVPDTSTKEFARQAHRDSIAVRNSPHASDDQAFVDAISSWNDE